MTSFSIFLSSFFAKIWTWHKIFYQITTIINVFSPDLESVFGRKKIAPKHTKQNVAMTRKIKYFKLLYFDKFSHFFQFLNLDLTLKKLSIFSHLIWNQYLVERKLLQNIRSKMWHGRGKLSTYFKLLYFDNFSFFLNFWTWTRH